MNCHDLVDLDRKLASGEARFDKDHLIYYVQSARLHPDVEWFQELKKRSMLHADALILLRALALQARSAILEVGPYMGASTIALGRGVKEAGHHVPVISMDVGGSYDHPEIGSKDIHADWQRNIEEAALSGEATLVKGWSYDPGAIAEVKALLAGRKIDLLVIDGNGDIESTLDIYRDVLDPNAWLVIDDYFNVITDQTKANKTATEMRSLMFREVIEEYALVPWGTWLGRLAA